MSRDIKVFNTLLEAWETSTMSDNRFARAIERIRWENRFFADGEYYFCLGGFTFTTPTLDPFGVHCWKPSAITSDGSFIEF